MSQFRFFLASTLLVAAFGLARCCPGQSMDVVDSQHIYPNANMVILFQLDLIEERLSVETREGLDRTHAWLKAMTGLDTAKCSDVIMQYGADEYPADAWQIMTPVGFVFRAEESPPQDQIDDFTQRFNYEQHSHNDSVYYSGGGPPVFQFNEHSLLIAEEVSTLNWIESSDLDDEPAILEPIDPEWIISAYVDFGNDSFRSFFAHAMTAVEFPDEACVDTICQNATSVLLKVDLEAMRAVTVTIEFPDSADMSTMTRACETFVRSAETACLNSLDLFSPGPNRETDEAMAAFRVAIEQFFSAAVVDHDDRTVTIEIEEAELTDNLLNSFVTMMNGLVAYYADIDDD